MREIQAALSRALWCIYRRPDRPRPWLVRAGNLPWDEPDFSRRMLAEHLDESHGAASRTAVERTTQLDWLWSTLNLQPDHPLLDITCGPGLYAVELARRGCLVTGLDFGPAALDYARQLASQQQLSERCTFLKQDIRQIPWPVDQCKAALLLYGQLAVFERSAARAILQEAYRTLQPGGQLVIELLNPDRIDKEESTWWFTDDTGLWGDSPFLHLGERFWLAEERVSLERYHILHLETGQMTEVSLCDQSYTPAEMEGLLKEVGFTAVDLYPAWDGLPLYDAEEWLVYVARK